MVQLLNKKCCIPTEVSIFKAFCLDAASGRMNEFTPPNHPSIETEVSFTEIKMNTFLYLSLKKEHVF